MKYINLHTHLPTQQDSIVEVTNLFLQDTPSLPTNGLYSVGLHPWHISEVNNNFASELEKLEGLLSSSRLLMIGECGLDRLSDATLDQQMPLFIEQIILAEKYHIPVLIHCVRAYPEILAIRKKLQIKTPFIFHSYTGNFNITELLLQENIFFSFGKHLSQGLLLQGIFKSLPLEKIFLETDNSNISIEELYELASVLLQKDIDFVKEQINSNFVSLFYYREQ